MTVRIPRAVLYILAAGLIIGVGVAGYVIVSEPRKECLSSSGGAISCDEPDSMSVAEYEQFLRDQAEAAEASAALAQCRRQTGGLMSALQELDSRLSVGLVYADYSKEVGNVRVAYDRVPTAKLEDDCLFDVGVNLENAMNSYVKADNIWNHCLTDFGCDNASIKPDLQAKWADATSSIGEAKSGLNSIGEPANQADPSSTIGADAPCVNATSGEELDCGEPGAVDQAVYEESPAAD